MFVILFRVFHECWVDGVFVISDMLINYIQQNAEGDLLPLYVVSFSDLPDWYRHYAVDYLDRPSSLLLLS